MTLLSNKKAQFNYEIIEKYEAGIELLGTETKSLRTNKGSLNGSYIAHITGELFLLGAHIPAHQVKNAEENFDPYRSRKLILQKKEILEIVSRLKEKGLTVVPISLYTKGRRIKAEIALVRGKKLFDKRETIKKRDTNRELRGELKRG